MRRPFLFPLLAALALLAAACADVQSPTRSTAPRAAVGSRAPAPVTVMSRNMYLGANIDALIAPGADPSVVIPQALAELQHTDYPERAFYLAQEIAARHPAAVGLQEVTHYIFDTAAGIDEMDWLDILQQYLAAMGAEYDVAVRQDNVTLVIPVGVQGINSVTYMDGDAILVRHDVAWSDPAKGHYTHQQELTVGPFTFENLRGWNAVTLELPGNTLRFVNTHMEIQAFRTVQQEQAQELVELLAGETLPIVLVGDFNSAANRNAPADSKTATYSILLGAGFADLESREAHSSTAVTCCRAANLTTPSGYDQRLDLVLTRYGRVGFGGESALEIVASPQFDDPHGYKLWPSDHAAVFAQLWPAAGLALR